MNRDDYMDGRVDHDTFYLAVADAIGRAKIDRIVRYAFTLPELAAGLAADSHLNSIPLQRWDNLHASVLQAVRENGRATMAVSCWSDKARHNLKPGTVCWSLAESVCVLKAAARRLVMEGSASAGNADGFLKEGRY